MGLENKQPDILAALMEIDMTVTPYGEVKEFLDKRARETMYKIKGIVNKVLSFEGDDCGCSCGKGGF